MSNTIRPTDNSSDANVRREDNGVGGASTSLSDQRNFQDAMTRAGADMNRGANTSDAAGMSSAGASGAGSLGSGGGFGGGQSGQGSMQQLAGVLKQLSALLGQLANMLQGASGAAGSLSQQNGSPGGAGQGSGSGASGPGSFGMGGTGDAMNGSGGQKASNDPLIPEKTSMPKNGNDPLIPGQGYPRDECGNDPLIPEKGSAPEGGNDPLVPGKNEAPQHGSDPLIPGQAGAQQPGNGGQVPGKGSAPGGANSPDGQNNTGAADPSKSVDDAQQDNRSLEEIKQNLQCPPGMQCGVSRVEGLAEQKQAYREAGAGRDFLASAMLETDGMNTDYAFGDGKSGGAANGGAAKQNVDMIKEANPELRNMSSDQVVSLLNNNKAMDVQAYNNSRDYHGDRFLAGHRNGTNGLANPNTPDINNFEAATNWTANQLKGHENDDLRFWVEVPPI